MNPTPTPHGSPPTGLHRLAARPWRTRQLAGALLVVLPLLAAPLVASPPPTQGAAPEPTAAPTATPEPTPTATPEPTPTPQPATVATAVDTPEATGPAVPAAPAAPADPGEAAATATAPAAVETPGEAASTAASPEVVGEAAPAPVAGEAAAEPAAEPAADPAVQPVDWRAGDDCELSGRPQDGIERSQRLLLETFCEATLWFDGLFGGDPDLRNARDVAGRVEISALHSEYWGTEYDVRLRLNYDLPTLERRLKLFLGRETREEFVEDRAEGLAVRSSVFAVEDEDRWLAGLGWAPPGRYREKIDFRIGGQLSTSPEVFVQGRYRQNVFVGAHSVWRLRETLFYENRDGFGSTTAVDFDHVLRQDLLFRFANIGTYSESSQGLEWRSTAVVYRNLLRARGAAAEVFARGATGAPVELREYGARLIYRHPLRRQSLFAEVIGGYSWPRELPGAERDGSAMIGLGLELLFGRDPF